MSQSNPSKESSARPTLSAVQAQQQAGDYQGSPDVQIEQLRTYIDQRIREHIHGRDARGINLETDLLGLFETVTAAPTGKPSIPFDQIKIYSSGGVFRLYVYDTKGQTWHYTTLT